MAGPIQQFEIKPLIEVPFGTMQLDFTNSSAWMVATIASASLFIILGMRKRALIPGRWQSMVEACYEFIANMVRDNAGHEGKAWFPLIFSLFMFILCANMLGLIPYSFTVTSHIIVTFTIAAFVFIAVTLYGIIRHGLHFFSLFVPHGAPKLMYPLMIPIEIISYLSRPISLSVRLFANMMAGHTMIKVFAGFVFGLGSITFGIGALAPIAMVVALTAFEVLIAFLQAYVFCVLTCLYLHDAIHLH
ncbi:MAG: F0F1 ATP synthase subunit A [Pseudomonadota bacterium]